MTDIASILGYILFGLSEILPFINIPTNGFLHTFILGFSKAFKNKHKDIELAQVLVEKQDFADIINKVYINPQIKTLIDTLINNPQISNTFNSILNNNSLYIQLQKITDNTKLQYILNTLIDNTQLISILSDDTETLKLLTPQNTTLLKALSKDVKMSEFILSIDPSQKNDIFNIVNIIKSNPELISDINKLINQNVV